MRHVIAIDQGTTGTTVLVLAGMSFIGVGAQPPSAEWGAMLAGAKRRPRIDQESRFARFMQMFVMRSDD